MPEEIELYGFYVFTHGWARVLTVMSPAGATAILDSVRAGADVEVKSGQGRLPQFHEKRRGALDRLVAANSIAVLTKADWDARKRKLGDAIYR